MSFSGITNFGMYCNTIVQTAFYNTGRVPLGQPLTPEELDYGITLLNMRVEALQDQKAFLWALDRQSFTAASIVSGAYTLPSDTLDILAKEVSIERTGSTSFVNLAMKSREDFYRIPDREQATGMPILFTVEKDVNVTLGAHQFAGALSMKFYPLPDNTTDVIEYTRVRRLQTMANAADDPEFPQRWQLALVSLLSHDLAPGLGVSMPERQDLVTRAMGNTQTAMRGDVERAPVRIFPRMGR